jgi:hypothetical protein
MRYQASTRLPPHCSICKPGALVPSSEALEDVMKNLILSALILLAPLACRADEITPLDVKPGLWEATVTIHSSGIPGIPAEALAQMSAEQRARIEAAMNAPHTAKSCMTSETLRKPLAFGDNPNSSCKRTVVRSSPGGMEFHVECNNGRTMSVGDGHVHVAGPESIKGEVAMSTTMEGGPTATSKVIFSSRWLGSDCGNVKPR